jgi:hypothetical protein
MTKTIIFAMLLTGLVVLGLNYENLAFGQYNPKELTVEKSVPWEKSQLFPGWFNQNMKWYLEGQMSEQELANGFEYLINENIIFLNPERAQEVADLRSENTALKKKLDTDGIIAPKTMAPTDDQGRVKLQFHWDEQTEQESLHHLRKAYDLNPNMQTKVIQFDKDHDKWIDVLSIDWGASSSNEDCSAAEGSSEEKSSCWIRVSQVHSAQETHDMPITELQGDRMLAQKMHQDRMDAWKNQVMHGTEITTKADVAKLRIEQSTTESDEYSKVKVKFPWLAELEGNPDRPIIVGGVPSSDSHAAIIVNKNDESGKLLLRILESKIQEEISQAEADMETVRNDRQLSSSQFENANQKASQYVNMLESVLKSINEMNAGIIRNLR